MGHDHHLKEVRSEQRKEHPGNNDGYVPHHPEPGHGDNPHFTKERGVHREGDCCYDHSAHTGGHRVANITGDQACFGEADSFRHMHHAHINSGTHSFHGASKQGHLRNSGHKGAHRVGHRGK